MKLLAETTHTYYPYSDKTPQEIVFSVHKLDSGKFQLTAQHPGLKSDGTPNGKSRWRTNLIESLVPLCISSSSFDDLTAHAIRNVVYDADDAEYASHAEERAADAAVRAQLEANANAKALCDTYTNTPGQK